ncbi:hypothetical protein JKF63_01689 [Porcisia hertigi]|uniref:Protein kinase domain-containing protein n=1 Tax=Porcisia hertigi TaxID=2761500 RepID=A0A836H569_9TRYP|nr:hypothetical protein JKF63_01689 [Porcisia hertigi]
MRVKIDDENSSVAVTLLPSAQVGPLTSSQPHTYTGTTEVTTSVNDALGKTADSSCAGSGPSSMATTTTTNAVFYYSSARLPTPPPLHRRSSSPVLVQQPQIEDSQAPGAVLNIPVPCESDSNEEPLFQHLPPATPRAPLLRRTHVASLPLATPQASQLGPPWGAVGATPPSAYLTGGGTAPYTPLASSSTPTAATTETLHTPAGQGLVIGLDTFDRFPAASTKAHGPASAANGPRMHRGYSGNGSDAIGASRAVGRNSGCRDLQQSSFMTGPASLEASYASSMRSGPQGQWARSSGEESRSGHAAPSSPATPANFGDTVLVAEPPTPAKQRRTIHRGGVGGRAILPTGGISADGRLSSCTAASTGAQAPGVFATASTGAVAGGGASPKPSRRVAVPLRGLGHNPTANNTCASASRAASSAVGTAPLPSSFKFHRHEGSRKRSADVLSQFSALDLDDTPATPFVQTGAGRLTSVTHNGNVYNAFPSQPSPSKSLHRGADGGIGAVSPLIIEYATPVTLSQQIGGSNTFSQMLLHASQDVLEMSQADTESSNFLARRILNEYNEVRLLGSGSFGTVSLFKEISSGEYVAVKVSPPLRVPEMERRYRRERSVMGMVRGLPHVVQLSAAWEEGRVPRMYLQLEYCPGGSVASVATEKQRRNEPWMETEVKVFLAHTCIALDALHRANIAHVDFKPDNILIDRDGAYKLSDFGCSVLLDERGRPRPETRNGYGSPAQGQRAGRGEGFAHANPNGGSALHTGAGAGVLGSAPDFNSWGEGNELSTVSVDEGDCRYLCADMLNEKQHFKAGDMFSLGMSLFEIMSGQPLPRNGDQFLAIRRRVPVEMLQRRGYSAELVELVVALLRSDPQQRPTARQVLQYLRPSSKDLQLLSSTSAMQRWTESAESFCRLQEEQQQDPFLLSGTTATTADSLRCVSALMEASVWLLTTTQKDVHRLVSTEKTLGREERDDEQHSQSPPHQQRPMVQLPSEPRLDELPMSPVPRGETCTPTALNY